MAHRLNRIITKPRYKKSPSTSIPSTPSTPCVRIIRECDITRLTDEISQQLAAVGANDSSLVADIMRECLNVTVPIIMKDNNPYCLKVDVEHVNNHYMLESEKLKQKIKLKCEVGAEVAAAALDTAYGILLMDLWQASMRRLTWDPTQWA